MTTSITRPAPTGRQRLQSIPEASQAGNLDAIKLMLCLSNNEHESNAAKLLAEALGEILALAADPHPDGDNLEETNMEKMNAAPGVESTASPSNIKLFDKIDVNLKKANAINRLMAYAANEGSLDLGEELIWANQVVGALIYDAMKSVAVLANQKWEDEA